MAKGLKRGCDRSSQSNHSTQFGTNTSLSSKLKSSQPRRSIHTRPRSKHAPKRATSSASVPKRISLRVAACGPAPRGSSTGAATSFQFSAQRGRFASDAATPARKAASAAAASFVGASSRSS